MSTSRWLGLWASILTFGLPRLAQAQDPPTRLPGMISTATPLPGPKIMIGVVRDTAGNVIPGAEIIIPGYARKLYSDGEGTFRFDDVPRGKHKMRARKIGYAPQIREFTLGDEGGIAEFELLPIARALPTMVTSVDRLGISGVVGDTAFEGIPAAAVRLMANGKEASTDSLGSFYIPAEPGKYMLRISKPGFMDKVVSVTVPRDSGRRITAWLQPRIRMPVREAHNIDDLQSRLAWTKPSDALYFTHDDLVKLGIEWVYDAVQMAWSRDIRPPRKEKYSRDCMVVVNGGPSIADLSFLTADEVESVEVYVNGAAARGTPGTVSLGPRGRSVAKASDTYSNLDRYAIENGARICPRAVYVWLR
jgi:hypothetical protein